MENYNPKDFNIMIDGEMKHVSDLTLKEARQQLCYHMRIIQSINDKAQQVTEEIDRWRNGEEIEV